MAKKDISEIIKRYEQNLESGKSVYLDADEFDELAEYYDTHNNIDSARDVIEAGLSIHPESRSLLIKKAKFLVYDGEYHRALKLLNNTFSEYDFDLFLLKIECYLQLGLHAEAYEMVREMLEKEEEEDMDTILSEVGFLYVEADLFDEAILYLEKSLDYNATKTDVLGDLAYSYEMVGNFNAAIVATNKILDIDPYSYEAWVNLGKLYSLQEMFEKAVDAFDFALTINDSDTNVIKLRAHCLSLSGRTEEAIEIFKELLDTRSEDVSVNLLLAECYQSLDMYDEALVYLARYAKSIDSINEPHDIYPEEGNLEMALEIVLQSLDGDHLSPELNKIAGDIYFKREQYDEAETYFLQTINKIGDQVPILDRLAIVAIKKEEYDVAADYMNRILALEPDNKQAQQRLALLYFELDDKDKYITILNSFSDEDLYDLFTLIYKTEPKTEFTRETMLHILNEARECRILFKNLRY